MKKTIKAIATKVINLFRFNKRTVQTYAFSLVSIVFLFAGGGFSSETFYEQKAFDLVQNAQKNRISKQVASLISSSETSKNDLLSVSDYCYTKNKQLYNTYPFQDVYCYNPQKKINCEIESLGELGSNMSFIVSTIFSNHKVKVSNGNERTVFDAYYFDLMFPDSNTEHAGFDNFCYISEMQAEHLLKSCNYDDFEDLINKPLVVTIDGKMFDWKISNIYYLNNKFMNAASFFLDNYIVCYKKIDTSASDIELLHCFQDDVTYNKSRLKEIKKICESKNFSFSLFNASQDDYYLIDSPKFLNTFSIVLIVFSQISYVGYILTIILKRRSNEILLIPFVLLACWLLTFLAFLIFGNVHIYSYVSVSILFIDLIISSVLGFFVVKSGVRKWLS